MQSGPFVHSAEKTKCKLTLHVSMYVYVTYVCMCVWSVQTACHVIMLLWRCAYVYDSRMYVRHIYIRVLCTFSVYVCWSRSATPDKE